LAEASFGPNTRHYAVKLLYSGASACDVTTLKRLLLVGDELCFTDRPSVMFGNWGTVGHASIFRNVETSGMPVALTVYDPPPRSAKHLYDSYAEVNFANEQFVQDVYNGLRDNLAFAGKLLSLEGNFGEGLTGSRVRAAILEDRSLANGIYRPDEIDPRNFFKVDSPEGRRQTWKMLLAEASIQVTTALLVANDTGAAPVSDDPILPKLITMRAASSKYVGESIPLSPYLGLEFAKAVIPDEVLQKLTVKDILDYRDKSKDLYQAWTSDLDRAAAIIDESEGMTIAGAVQKLMATEFTPKIISYRNEMQSIRDALFGDLVKTVVTWEVPTLSLAYLTDLGLVGAVGAFVAGLRAVTPPIVDYVKARREIGRKHSISYLIGLAKPD
jgi:hypothetical protein